LHKSHLLMPRNFVRTFLKSFANTNEINHTLTTATNFAKAVSLLIR